MIPRLERLDIEEKRSKCDICGYELTVAEILTTHNRCVFHATEGVDRLRGMSWFAYIRHLLNDLKVAKTKLSMKAKGLTEVDYAACLCETGKDLVELDINDMEKLLNHMGNHGSEAWYSQISIVFGGKLRAEDARSAREGEFYHKRYLQTFCIK